jgi:hypothetical protein
LARPASRLRRTHLVGIATRSHRPSCEGNSPGTPPLLPCGKDFIRFRRKAASLASKTDDCCDESAALPILPLPQWRTKARRRRVPLPVPRFWRWSSVPTAVLRTPDDVIFAAENSPGILGVSCVRVAHPELHNRNVHNKQEDGASTICFRRQSKRRDSYGERPSRCRAAPRGTRSFRRFWDCASGDHVDHPGATGLAPAQNLLRQGNIDGARPPGHHQRSHDIAGEIPCRANL